MKLKQAALSFEKLLDIEYKIILGRKNKETEFLIGFSKDHFFHLVGLQKLTDIDFPTENKGDLFDLILKGEITDDFISKSSKFDSILKERLDPFIDIVDIMDTNSLIFKFNRGHYNWSNMRCKFILENIEPDKTIYVFIDSDEDILMDGEKVTKMFCRSFFLKGATDFTARSTSMALIYKEKINKKTNESIVQLNKLKT